MQHFDKNNYLNRFVLIFQPLANTIALVWEWTGLTYTLFLNLRHLITDSTNLAVKIISDNIIDYQLCFSNQIISFHANLHKN